MDLRIFIEPQQGTTYSEVAALARRAEEHGFDGFFSSDHYLNMGDQSSGLPGPLDAWSTMAGLARDTERLRLGTLVSPITFHHPAQLAIRVAQIDEMSSGRIELGLGAGWFEQEHIAHGIEFPEVGERFDRLGEALEIISGLWKTAENDSFSFDGEHYQLVESPALPKPWQRPGPPIIVGGRGRRRTPAFAATYASEFNVAFEEPTVWRALVDSVTEACEARERDPETLAWSVAQVVCIGENEAEFARRSAAIGREPSELRANGIAGLPDEAAEKLHEFAGVGCTRVYLQVLDLKDLEHVQLISTALGSNDGD